MNIDFNVNCIRADPQAGICELFSGNNIGITGPTGSSGISGIHPWEIVLTDTINSQTGVRLNYTDPFPGVAATLDFVVPATSTEGMGSRLMFDTSKSAVRGGFSNGGWDDALRGDFSTAFGSDTVASGINSTVGGGNNNTATNSAATVSGGSGNNAIGSMSTVGGGSGNNAVGDLSIIGGGGNNVVNGNNSAIIGGNTNSISNLTPFSIIGGGENNIITGVPGNQAHHTIGGGENNLIDGNANHGAICGGINNRVSFDISFVGGGTNNTDH